MHVVEKILSCFLWQIMNMNNLCTIMYLIALKLKSLLTGYSDINQKLIVQEMGLQTISPKLNYNTK